jgi:hypothetical protein
MQQGGYSVSKEKKMYNGKVYWAEIRPYVMTDAEILAYFEKERGKYNA